MRMKSTEKKHRLCAISVDLDEIPNYFRIHGLDPARAGAAATAVYDVALDRIERFANDMGVPLTLFAIGADLARPEAAARLRRASEAGFEIANHSLDHLYDLTRRERRELIAQVDGGVAAIVRATGVRPVGFRAPGYTMTDELMGVLGEVGVAYDSSVFPCPAYWIAKTSAIGWIALRGRSSRSVVDTPLVLASPTRPYRTGRPYWRRGDGGLELPVQVTRGLRLPFIGTTVTLAGPDRARWLANMCAGEPLVNLELHGIDLLAAGDGLDELAPHQPDVRVPLVRKRDALAAVIETLRAAGHAFVTLREAAEYFV